jgi:hypothetical protein
VFNVSTTQKLLFYPWSTCSIYLSATQLGLKVKGCVVWSC